MTGSESDRDESLGSFQIIRETSSEEVRGFFLCGESQEALSCVAVCAVMATGPKITFKKC